MGQQPKAPSAPFRDCVRRIHSAAGLHTPGRVRTGTGRHPSEVSLICRKPSPILIHTLPYTWETTSNPWRKHGATPDKHQQNLPKRAQHVAASGPNRVRSRPPMRPLGSRRSDVLRRDRVINMRQSTVLPPCHTISATLHIFIVILSAPSHIVQTPQTHKDEQMGDPVLR